MRMSGRRCGPAVGQRRSLLFQHRSSVPLPTPAGCVRAKESRPSRKADQQPLVTLTLGHANPWSR
jgi:hypothetical protein